MTWSIPGEECILTNASSSLSELEEASPGGDIRSGGRFSGGSASATETAAPPPRESTSSRRAEAARE